jgi:hypothetical protein
VHFDDARIICEAKNVAFFSHCTVINIQKLQYKLPGLLFVLEEQIRDGMILGYERKTDQRGFDP